METPYVPQNPFAFLSPILPPVRRPLDLSAFVAEWGDYTPPPAPVCHPANVETVYDVWEKPCHGWTDNPNADADLVTLPIRL